MKRGSLKYYILFLFVGLSSIVLAQDTWYSLLQVNGAQIELFINVYSEDSATINSPTQKFYNHTIENFTLTQDSLVFSDSKLMFKYKGRVYPDSIKGVFSQLADVELNWFKEPIKVAYDRPQTPKPPFSYAIDSVKIYNKEAKINLSGTLCYPKHQKPKATIITLTGSGAQDRDETIMGHKLFWIISDYLVKQGYAVLRYDDRGVNLSEGIFTESDIYDFASDCESAISYLKKKKFKNIGLLGHSEGGMVAQIVASKNKDVDFNVFMASPIIDGKTTIEVQVYDITKQALGEEQAVTAKQMQTKILNSVVLGDTTLTRSILKEENPEESEESIELTIKTLYSSSYLSFIGYDAEQYLKLINQPTLALFGSKDLQVNAVLNSKVCTNYNFLNCYTFEGLNHLFQTANTGEIEEYGAISETINPDVLTYIKNWLDLNLSN